MPDFDRFDVCEAHLVLEWDYNIDGILMERPRNSRCRQSTGVQLHRMKFNHRPGLEYKTLTRNGRLIYHTLRKRYKLPK